MGSSASTSRTKSLIQQCRLAIKQRNAQELDTLMKYSIDEQINIFGLKCNHTSPFAYFVINAINEDYSEEEIRTFCKTFKKYNSEYPIQDYRWMKYVVWYDNKLMAVKKKYRWNNVKYDENIVLRTNVPLYLIMNGIKLVISKEKQPIINIIMDEIGKK
jgi:hypothetical protein